MAKFYDRIFDRCRNPGWQSLLKPVWGMLAALLLMAISLSLYAVGPYTQWQTSAYDGGDYRFLAEKFWQIPHDYSTYIPYYREGFRFYLEAVPVRSIGAGSFSLAAESMNHLFPASPGRWSTTLMLAVQIIAYIFFFRVCLRRFGPGLSVLMLTAMLFPAARWRYADHLMTESLTRTVFIGMLACVLAGDSPRRLRHGMIFMLLGVFLAHLKVQWTFFDLFM